MNNNVYKKSNIKKLKSNWKNSIKEVFKKLQKDYENLPDNYKEFLKFDNLEKLIHDVFFYKNMCKNYNELLKSCFMKCYNCNKITAWEKMEMGDYNDTDYIVCSSKCLLEIRKKYSIYDEGD